MRWIAATWIGLMACLIVTSTAWASSPFLFFFDSGSIALSGRASAIIDIAAHWILTADAREVEVTGFADRVGSSASNLRLSRRRADAVKAALVERGVPARLITVRAMGEGRPLIKTADGVAEQQNRFVTITMGRVCRPPEGFGQPSPGC